MTEPIDHQRCSELLGAYVAAELSERERAAVESHLASCSECEQERVALVALVALVAGDVEPLGDDERARLRERVGAALAPARGDVIGIAPARGRQARWGQVVGIAASVVLLVAGLFYVGTQGLGGGDDEAATGLSEEEAPAVEDAGAGRGARPASKDQTRFEAGQADAETEEESAAALGATAGGPEPGPLFDARAGRVTERDLTRLGRRGAPFVSYAATYTVSDALARRDAFLDDLVALAPDSATGDDIQACSERVFSGAVDAILPAYGALGRLHQEEALILGYAWSDRSEGPLYRWMFWAWSPGDCDGLNTLYQTGRISR